MRSFHRGGGRNSRGFRGGRQGGGRRFGGRGDSPSGPVDLDIEELGVRSDNSVTIAIEGCCHGELDGIYDRLARHEQTSGRKIDLLLCCGDFQSVRNTADFHSMAVPPKYRALGSFYRYYSGQKQAPILTVFVGGNHEASQPLQELYYGGWVAPNIYYLGAAGVVCYQGIRIGGISGIYKSHDYCKGRYETPPLDNAALRSVYHVRQVDVYRLKCYAQTAENLRPNSPIVNVMLSHDWPRGIEQHGNTEGLLKKKPFFRDEVQQNCLGSPPNEELLHALKPPWWFAAHLHVKFKATLKHKQQKRDTLQLTPSQVIKTSPSKLTPDATRNNQTTEFVGMSGNDPCSGADLTDLMTQFLSLDKCLPRRHFLSIVHVEKPIMNDNTGLSHDPEWLAVLQKTHYLSSTNRGSVNVPVDLQAASREEVDVIRASVPLEIDPTAFQRTVPAHQGPPAPLPRQLPPPLRQMGNPQTDNLLQKLGLDHVITIPYNNQGVDENEIILDYGVAENADQPNVLQDDDNVIDLEDDADDENAIDLELNETENKTKTTDESSKRPRVNS